jgi:hypothetical protein
MTSSGMPLHARLRRGYHRPGLELRPRYEISTNQLCGDARRLRGGALAHPAGRQPS